MPQANLKLVTLKQEAQRYLKSLSQQTIADLYGVDNGKAIGTFVEHGFHAYLQQQYAYVAGSSASGIDFPDLNVDLKVTSNRQPQSSCPFRSATQKIYGLGYHLLVFVYQKEDDEANSVATFIFDDAIFIEQSRTGDYQTTRGIRTLLDNDANVDDIDAFLEERNLPLDEVGRRQLAERILEDPPEQGYITISNALQWRLQYGRAVRVAREETINGLESLL